MIKCENLGSLIQLELLWHPEDIYHEFHGQLAWVMRLISEFLCVESGDKVIDYPSKVVLTFTIKKCYARPRYFCSHYYLKLCSNNRKVRSSMIAEQRFS